MLRRHAFVPGLIAALLFGLATAATAAPGGSQRLVYQVHHSRYGTIGTYTNAVEKSGDSTRVQTEAHIAVSILGVVLYRQDAKREEQWNGNRLMSFKGVTTTNGKPMEMSGEAMGDRFVMMSPEGDVVAPAMVRIANPWSPDVLRGDTLITPDRGHMESVQVKGGEETSVALNGRSTKAKHYEIDRLDGAKRYEVWLDDRGTPVMFTMFNPGGTVTFTLSG